MRFTFCGKNQARLVGHVVVALMLVGCDSDVATTPETGEIDSDPEFEFAEVPIWQETREVVVKLRTSSGAPVRGARVDWRALDGGRVQPQSSVSDSLGLARTRWTLGDSVNHAVVAKARGFAPRTVLSRSPLTEALPIDRFMSLSLATYDGSGQTVHPDYLRINDSPLNGPFLGITPYKGGNTYYENPSLYASTDEVQWKVPSGGRNPVALPTQRHLSDPDIVHDPAAQELLMYFREVGNENTIWLIRSADGARWTTRQAVVVGPNHEVVSPSVVRRSAGEWLMWTVNAHSGCTDARADVELRRSSDGRQWSAPMNIDLRQGDLMPWHIEVQWVPSRQEYWALYNVKAAGTCNTTALFLATSTNGVEWTKYPTPVLTSGVVYALTDIVYRSTFFYDSSTDVITFWFSGARYDGSAFVWNTVAQRRTRSDVFGSIAIPPAYPAFGRAPMRIVPQLRRPP